MPGNPNSHLHNPTTVCKRECLAVFSATTAHSYTSQGNMAWVPVQADILDCHLCLLLVDILTPWLTWTVVCGRGWTGREICSLYTALVRLSEVVAGSLSCQKWLTFALSHYKCTQESFIILKAACISREENSPGKSTPAGYWWCLCSASSRSLCSSLSIQSRNLRLM